MSELFSINRLSQLLEKDRGTITRAVRDLPPDGRDRQKNPRWKISTVVEAMSQQSGSSSNPRMTALADELEVVGNEAIEVLEQLRALPSITERRKYAQSGACTVIGRLNKALEACEQSLRPADRGVWAITTDVAIGQAIAEIMSLCNFKIRPEDLESE
jgi:hypothetical protein